MKKAIKRLAIIVLAIVLVALIGDILLDSFVRMHSEKPGGELFAYNDHFTLVECETRILPGLDMYTLYTATPDSSDEICDYLMTLDEWQPLPVAPSTRGDIIDYVFDMPWKFKPYVDFETLSGLDANGAWRYEERYHEGVIICSLSLFLNEENVLINALAIRYR